MLYTLCNFIISNTGIFYTVPFRIFMLCQIIPFMLCVIIPFMLCNIIHITLLCCANRTFQFFVTSCVHLCFFNFAMWYSYFFILCHILPLYAVLQYTFMLCLMHCTFPYCITLYSFILCHICCTFFMVRYIIYFNALSYRTFMLHRSYDAVLYCLMSYFLCCVIV